MTRLRSVPTLTGMLKQPKKYGLTRAEWRSLFVAAIPEIVAACTEVAANANAFPADRELSTLILGDMVQADLVPPILPCGATVPEIIRDVALNIAKGRSSAPDEEQRKLCAERVAGVRLFHGTLGPLLDLRQEPDADEVSLGLPALVTGAN